MMLFPEGCVCVQARTPQLAFHDPIEIDGSMGAFTEEDLSPVNGLRSPPYKFDFTPKTDSVIDLRYTLLDVRVMVVDANGQPVSRDDETFRARHLSLVGNPISSLWKRIETRLNEKLINVESARNIPHKGVIEDWLEVRRDKRSYPQGVREKFILGHGPFENHFYTNYKHGSGKMNDGNIVQFVGPIPVDFLRVNNYLSPRTHLTLSFYPHSGDFTVMNAGTNGYKVIIKDLTIHIRRIYPAPAVLPLLPQLGQDKKELYCGRFATVRDYQMPKGAVRWKQHVIAGAGLLPKFVLVGMVNAEVFGGGTGSSKKSDPCYFHHYSMNHLQLRAGEKFLPATPYTPLRQKDVTGGNREFYSLFEQTGMLHHFISMEEYRKGATIFPFNLLPDMASLHSPVLRPPKYGPMSIELGFAEPLPETVSLVVYLMYNQVISIVGANGTPVEEQF